jgi:sporulation protein YqfC
LIKINLSRGYLELEGEDFEIKFIMQDELSLTGVVKSLRFV